MLCTLSSQYTISPKWGQFMFIGLWIFTWKPLKTLHMMCWTLYFALCGVYCDCD